MHTRLSGWVVTALCMMTASAAQAAKSAASAPQVFACDDILGVADLAWSDDSRFLAGIGVNVVCMLDTATHEIKRKSNLMFVTRQPRTHRFLAVRNWLKRGAKPYLQLMDATTGKVLAKRPLLRRKKPGLSDYTQWSPDGALFSWGSGANRLTITATQRRHIMDVDDASVFGIDWSPLGSYFTLPRYSAKVAIFDTIQQRQILEATTTTLARSSAGSMTTL